MYLKEIIGFLKELWEVFPGYHYNKSPEEEINAPMEKETIVEKPVEQIKLLPDVVVCADDDRMLLNAFALAQSKFISDKAIESISAHSRENDVVYDIMLSLFNEDSKTPINDAYNLFYAQYEAYLEKEEKNNINTPFIIYSALPNKIGAFGKWYVAGTPAYVFLMCFIDWHMYCNCYETSFTEVDRLIVNKLGNLISNTKRRNIQLRSEYAVTNDFIADLATGDCATKKEAVSNWVKLVNGGGIYKQDKNYYAAIVNKGSAQKIEWQIIANSAISKLSEAYVMIDALWKIFPGENPTYAHQKYAEPEFVPSAKFIEGISIKQVQKTEPKPITAGVNMTGTIKISEIESLIMLGISSAEKIKELQDKVSKYINRSSEYQKFAEGLTEQHKKETIDIKEKLSVMETENKNLKEELDEVNRRYAEIQHLYSETSKKLSTVRNILRGIESAVVA